LENNRDYIVGVTNLRPECGAFYFLLCLKGLYWDESLSFLRTSNKSAAVSMEFSFLVQYKDDEGSASPKGLAARDFFTKKHAP